MNSKLILKFTLLSFLFLSPEAFSKQEDKKILKDFSSTQFSSFEEIMKDKTVAVLFQPNCRSCKRQIKNLDCLKEVSSKIVLVGSFGAEEKVRRSYLKKKSEFKGYYINEDLVTSLGFESGIAPQTVYYKSNKALQFVGYKSCKKIVKKIKELDGNS